MSTTNKIHVEYEESAQYPENTWDYSPSEGYPEYCFKGTADEKNKIYEMVRNSLFQFGLDQEHFGSKEWNPLGEIVKPGNSVLIKPNLVSHMNPAGGMECMVTHPSVLRALIDYTLIALQGTGKITVADAPVQSCDFEQLFTGGGYKQLTDFYISQGIQIDFVDMRGIKSRRDENGILLQEQDDSQKAHTVLVNLGRKSAFDECTQEHLNRLRITNYASYELNAHHQPGKHEYMVSDYVLNADVVINVPKPKTHRKGGITGAQKNMVGINVDKCCLPHHTYGGKNSGGDEYPSDAWYTRTQSWLHDCIDSATKQRDYRKVKRFQFVLKCILAFGKLTGIKKKYRIKEGNWSGNDTIWRMVCDLNRILQYSDAEGNICENQQRKLFTIADMIVCGEGEGPLNPEPYHMGMIVSGYESICIDRAIAGFWGIDWRNIPCIAKISEYNRTFKQADKGTVISSNSMLYNIGDIETLNCENYRHIKMPSGWENV